ncbi:MAG: glucose 1-dehydrogenase [Deltaproteobacteria bacterium]|nr:glucose 1-dehydrogenase [Deltaproteobacteria bacterium]
MDTLKGKVAVVTGASRGIGRATAERLAKDGAAVVVNYATSAAEANAVVEGIKAQGGKALAIQADIAKLEDIRRLYRETLSHLARLDIVVANAGYSCFKPMADITEEDFDRTYALNAKGTYFCLQEALRYLVDGGKIVCVSTIGTVLNVSGGACYFGSKAAVEQFCRVLAKEVAPRRITVNVVSPGFTETKMLLANMGPDARRDFIEMTPLHRLGQPEEVAEVIAFLVSERARWVTRQNLAVDGGIISR